MFEKQDSNQVGLYLSREVNGALDVNPVFETREPNSYGKFGAEYKKVKRNPFNVSRQNAKGTTSDADTSGEWNEDVTQNNMYSLLEGFFFAAMRKKSVAAVTAIVTPDNEYTVADGTIFPVGSIVAASGFANGANNGAKHVTAVDATHVTVSEVLAAEAPGASALLTRVGVRAAAGDAKLSIVGNLVMLAFTAYNPAGLGLIPGEWVFVGGDLAATQFATVKPGYARVSSVDVAGKKIYFDKFTSVAAADIGAGKTIEIYTGFLVKNEDDPDLIVKSTFTAERPLGKDDDGTQSENLSRFVFNSLKWNSPLTNKVSVDVTGIGLDYDTRDGVEGLLSKTVAGATVTKALREEAFNTSTNVYRIRLSLIDPTTYAPTPLFARVTEFSVTINNNATAAKSQGDLGGFDTTVGQFDVSAAMTAYFSTVAAITAIKNDDDCTFDAIYAKHGAGIILDLPLVSVGGGNLTIAQNQPIMMPLTNDAAESPFGHTALINFFPSLPAVAMAKGG